jgi:hypothetical protein
MTTSEAFLADVEAFLEQSKMKATVFGWQAVRDPNFVSDLRTGRRPTLGLVERVHEFIRRQNQASVSNQTEHAS